MNEQKPPQDELRPHQFDGIQEYDNQLPRWWLYLFYMTIVFTPAYLIYYHVAGGRSLSQELETDLSEQDALMQKKAALMGEADLSKLADDPALVAAGKTEYDLLCASCHGAEGAGLIGPNLTDAFWIHGGKPADIHKTIADGVLEKGMPAWLPTVGPDKVNQLTAFVMSIKNRNIAGKDPQGTEEK